MQVSLSFLKTKWKQNQIAKTLIQEFALQNSYLIAVAFKAFMIVTSIVTILCVVACNSVET